MEKFTRNSKIPMMIIMLAITLAIILTGCGGGGGGGTSTPTTNPTANPTIVPTLSQIEIYPLEAAIAAGTSQKFTVTGIYRGKNKDDMTLLCNYTSSDPSIATVDATGNAKSLKPGNVTITATDPVSGFTSNATLHVTNASVSQLQVTPAATFFANGSTVQFTAMAVLTDGTTQNLTTQVFWVSSNTAVATVSNAPGTQGLVTGVGFGSAVITATLGNVTSTNAPQIEVVPVALVSVNVTPVNPTMARGTSQQFTATGVYNDGSQVDLTTTVTWSSSAPSIADVANVVPVQGLTSAFAAGQATITATDTTSGLSGSSLLTVSTANLVSIDVSPVNTAVPAQSTVQYVAMGHFDNNTIQDITKTMNWSSTNIAAATISNAVGSEGLLSTLAVGTSTISATDPTTLIAGQTNITVTPNLLTRIKIYPAGTNIFSGSSIQFSAEGIYSNGTTQNLTNQVTWLSSDPANFTISNAPGSQGRGTSTGVANVIVTANHVNPVASATTNLSIILPQTGWRFQNTLPIANGIWGVKFVDVNNGWAVSECGNIIHTIDGGLTWAIQKSSYDLGVNCDLFGLKFVGLLDGWVVGDGAILHTTDGGVTWVPQVIPAAPTAALTLFQKIDVANDKLHAITVGDGGFIGAGLIMYTADGGTTWTEGVINGQVDFANFYIMDIVYPNPADPTIAVCVGGSSINPIGEPQGQIILQTTDSGATWTALSRDDARGGLWGVSFLDANNGIAVGDEGNIVITTDAGTTWTPVTSPVVNPVILTSAHWVDANNIWIGGEFFLPNGPTTMLHSGDGGVTWENQVGDLVKYPTLADDFLAINFVDATHGWGVGTLGAIYYTVDGGLNWTSARQGAEEGINQAAFVDSTYGWAVGLAGLLVHTTDGGNSWIEQDNPATANMGMSDLLCVSFVDRYRGWTGGTGAWIMNTVDGGMNWVVQTVPPTFGGDVHGIAFVDAAKGFAVGDNGGLLQTSDGGANWNDWSANTGTTQVLNSVHFINANKGWAVGESGTVIYTTDGGQTWNTKVGVPAVPYYSVFFLDANHGWISGGGYHVLRTTDGGATWQDSLTDPTGLAAVSDVNTAVRFGSATTGYAVTVGGDIFMTVDGGANWTLQYYFTANPLYGINCFDALNVWIVGDGGTIIHTISGGLK